MAYIGKSPTGTGVRSRYFYTAAGAETSLSGADDNNKTLTFTDGEYVDVYVNGVLLFDGDYNTNTANTISGLSALVANDVVEVVVYDVFTVADTVSAKNGGTFSGNVTMNGDLTVDGGTIKLDGNYPTGTNNVALGDGALGNGSLTGGANVSIGHNSLNGNQGGQFNTAVGSGSLYSNVSGDGNTAIGEEALLNNTASNNTAVGRDALRVNTTGTQNIAVGNFALDANTTGGINVAIGYNALSANTTASNNTAMGHYALSANTTGARNTAIGTYAADAQTTAFETTAVGFAALGSLTTGERNTAVGAYAADSVTTGVANTAVGDLALQVATTGTQNTAVGYLAADAITTGNYNTAIGVGALGSATTGTYNTMLGHSAGNLITTGAKNTIIGAYNGNQNGLDIRTSSNNIVLSDGDGNPRVHVNSGGAVQQKGVNEGSGYTGSTYTPTISRLVKREDSSTTTLDLVFTIDFDSTSNTWETSCITLKVTKVNTYSGENEYLVGEYWLEMQSGYSPRSLTTIREDKSTDVTSPVLASSSNDNCTITVTITDSTVDGTPPYQVAVGSIEVMSSVNANLS